MWNEGVIQELARLKKRTSGRNTRLKNARSTTNGTVSGNDGGSLASSMESSLGSRGRIGSGDGGGGGIGGREAVGKKKSSAGGGSGQKNNHRASAAALTGEPRSRFALSLVIPRPIQHDGLVFADFGDCSSGSGEGREFNNNNNSNNNRSAGNNTSSQNNNSGRGGGHVTATSSTSSRYPNASSSAAAKNAASGPASAAATWGSKLRLDIVRADAERSAGSPRSPRPGTEGGGGVGVAAATARFDSAAREILQGYEDEQVRQWNHAANKLLHYLQYCEQYRIKYLTGRCGALEACTSGMLRSVVVILHASTIIGAYCRSSDLNPLFVKPPGNDPNEGARKVVTRR